MQYQLTAKLVFIKSASSAPQILAKLQALPIKNPTLTEIIVGYNQDMLSASVEATGSALAMDAVEKVLRQAQDELAQPAVLTATDENGEVTHVAFGRIDAECERAEALAYLGDMDQRAADIGNSALIRALNDAKRYLEEEIAWVKTDKTSGK
ncbi:MAG: hypothetical protein ACYDEV_00535 [Acidiferrobacter sp.]